MRIALVALAVALAGCPALSGPTPTAEVTPAPVPETEQFPPGVTEAGVVDAETLATTHADAVQNTSYTIVSNRTIRHRNGTIISDFDVRVELAADRQVRATVATAGPSAPLLLGEPPASGEFWANGTAHVSKLTTGNSTQYTEFTPPDGFVGTWRYWRSTVSFGGQGGHAQETLLGLFADIPTEVADSRSADGRQVYRLVGDSARSASFAKAGAGPVSNVSLETHVTSTGIVRQFELSYEQQVGGEPAQVHWSLQYLDVGNTTAERPTWIDRALDQSSSGPADASS